MGVLNLGEARELSAKAARYLAEVVDNPEIASKNRIAASRALMAHHQWREEYEREQDPAWQLYRLMVKALGSDEAMRFLKSDEGVERFKALLPSLKSANVSLPEGELAGALDDMLKAGAHEPSDT